MKNRRADQIAPVAALVGAVIVLGVAGAKVAAGQTDRAPEPKTFAQNGQTYRWNVAHGVVGSLSLSREVALPDVPGMSAIAGGEGVTVRAFAPELVLACSGLRSGSISTRLDAASGVVRVTAGSNTLAMAPGDHDDLPRDFFRSLGAAPKISVAQSGRMETYPGPGKALAAHFQRYCASLDRRAPT